MRNPIVFFYLPFHRKMIKEISSYIEKGDRVLDFGCGRGAMSFLISQNLGAQALGIDVRDGRDFDIPFKEYDGCKIPFSDNHFDVVLSSYVLHHTPNIKELLGEIKRVCRKYIIIYEDTPANFFQRIFCGLHGRSYNGFFKINSGYRFLSVEEWQNLFTEQQLKLVRKKNLGPPYFTKRTLFVLEK